MTQPLGTSSLVGTSSNAIGITPHTSLGGVVKMTHLPKIIFLNINTSQGPNTSDHFHKKHTRSSQPT
jgi:hypothetical protein